MLNLSAEELNALAENIKDVKSKMNNESNDKDENNDDALEDLTIVLSIKCIKLFLTFS